MIITVAWIAAERARLAQRRAAPLPRPAWATFQEITDRGVGVGVVAALIDETVGRGLLAHDDARDVTLAAHEYAERSARSNRGKLPFPQVTGAEHGGCPAPAERGAGNGRT